MSLKIKNLAAIPMLDRLKLVAGEGGMERNIATAGIADYEFTEGFEDREKYFFEEDSFVISSLLFAKDAPEKILPAVKALYDYGTAAFAYKNVIFEKLPDEVLEFANEHDYPIYVFGRDLFFEDIMYRVIAEVRKEDNSYMSEENLAKMIEGRMTPHEVEEAATNISLNFKKYARCVFVRAVSAADSVDVDRAVRTFSLSKNQKSKGLIVRYDEGLFILTTCPQRDEASFDLILNEILETSSLKEEEIRVYKSRIHTPFDELDMCIRESWHTFIAEKAEGKCFVAYDDIGTYKYLITLKEQKIVKEFSREFLAVYEGRGELLETMEAFVFNEGDVGKSAEMLCCHQNTVRYRLAKAKALAGMETAGEAAFYEQMSAALKIRKLKDL